MGDNLTHRMSFDARRERDESLWRSIKVRQKDVPRTIRNYLNVPLQ